MICCTVSDKNSDIVTKPGDLQAARINLYWSHPPILRLVNPQTSILESFGILSEFGGGFPILV